MFCGRFGAKAFAASLLLLLGTARGQTVYYSNFSGDGLWGTGANWGDASTANLGVVPPAAASLVFSDRVFSNSAGFQLTSDQTVTLGQNRTATSLQFDAAFNYTLQGNTLTLDNGATAASITVTRADPGGGHTIQSGLTLYSNLIVSANANTALTLAGPITAGVHTFTIANNGTVTFAGAISGSGTFTQDSTSTGTTILAGDSAATFTGNIIAQNGTIQLGASDVLRAATALTLGSGTATFDLAGKNQTLGSLTFTGGTVQSGAGMLTLGGTVTTNASSGAAEISGNLNLGNATRTFAIAAGSASPDLTIAANISGTGGINKTGTGSLLLGGNNTYTGANTFTTGLTIAGSNNALGAGNTAVSSGATLALEGEITLTSGPVTVVGTGYTGTNGAIDNLSDDNTLASNVILGGATQLGAAAGTQLTLLGNISQTAASSLTIGGSGTVVLGGANTYSGATTVNAGATLVAAANNALGNPGTATATTVTAGGTLGLQGNITLANETITITGDGVGGSGALTAVADDNAISTAVTLGGNATVAAAENASLTLTGGVTDGASTFNLTKSDGGTVILTAAASYGGTTTINGGTLKFAGTAGALASTAAITVNGGTLSLDNSTGGNTNRIAGAITLNDGGMEFIGSGTASSTESVAITAGSGANNVHLLAGTGQRADLTITNLTQTNNASIAFFDDGGTLGSGLLGSARVFLTKVNGTNQGGTPTSPTALPGWILVGNDFAEYTGGSGTGNGIRAVSSYNNSGLGLNVNVSTANVLLDGDATSTEYTLNRGLTTSTTVDGNLKIADLNSGGGTSVATLLDTRTLVLNNGGIIKSAGTNNVTDSTIAGATARLQSGVTNLTVTTDAGTKLTINPIIQDYQNSTRNARGLLKAGAGTLVLTGTNTYTGSNFLNDGILQISKEANLGAATNDLTFGGSATLAVTGSFTTNTGKAIKIVSNATGTFDIASGQTLTISGTTLTSGNTASVLEKTNAGNLVITSSNTGFTGSVVLDAGTLELDAASALGTAAKVTLNGGTLRLKNNLATTFTSNLAVTANATIAVEPGTTGTNLTHTIGTLAIGSQTLTTTSGSGFDLKTGAVTLTGDAVFNPATSGSDLSVGAISGAGSVTKIGAGKMALTAASTYSGPTTVNAGTLTTAGANFLPTATALTIAAGATVTTSNFNQTLSSLSGNGTLNVGTAALTVGDSTSTVFSGTITAATFAKNGAGTLTLDGSLGNSITTFRLNDGIILAAKLAGSATGTGAVTVGDGTGAANSAVLRLGAANQISDSSAVTLNFDGRLDLNGNNETVASIAGSGSLYLGSATLSLAGNGSTTYSGAISGTGGLTKSGTGTLTLSGSSTYSGPTTIAQGTVSISSATALGTGAGGVTIANGAGLNLQGGLAISGATLALAGNGAAGTGALYSISGNNTWGRQLTLTGAATMNVAAGNLTLSGGLDTGGYAATFASTGNTQVNGAIIGAGSVTKTGSGVLVLGATGNSYTGATTINAGTLQFGVNNAGPSASAVNLAATGTALNLNNYSGTVGSLAGVDGSTVSLGSGSLTAGSDNSSTTLASAVTGSGAFTKAGSGTMTIAGSATNSMSGGFNVNDGAIILNKAAGLDATGTGALKIGDNIGGADSASVKLGSQNQINDGVAVTIGSDGKLDLNNNSERFASLAGATGASVTLGSGTLTVGASNATTTFSGSISGTGGLIKEGSGTLTLGGTSSFTGATTINGGTLVLAASNAISATASLTISSGSGLRLAGNVSQTVAGLSSTATSTIDLGANASLTVNAGATSTLLGSLTGTGTLAYLNGGTLTLNSTVTFGTLVLGGTGTTTLQLGTYNLTLDTLHITGNTILDFSGAGANRLSTTNLIIDPGAAVSVIGWVNLTDYFIATNFSGATLNVRGAAPENQITFQGYTGADTKWSSFNHEITPAPEPETYGALLIGAAVGFLGFRRWRRRTAMQV